MSSFHPSPWAPGPKCTFARCLLCVENLQLDRGMMLDTKNGTVIRFARTEDGSVRLKTVMIKSALKFTNSKTTSQTIPTMNVKVFIATLCVSGALFARLVVSRIRVKEFMASRSDTMFIGMVVERLQNKLS